MVALHQQHPAQRIVVKRGRRKSVLARPPSCLWPGCGATLAHDHDAPVCGCHVRPSYNLSHDKHAPATVLHLVLAAYPSAIDLCGVLRCTSHQLQAPLDLLRRRGHTISGARRGYVYEPAFPNGDRPRRGVRKVKA